MKKLYFKLAPFMALLTLLLAVGCGAADTPVPSNTEVPAASPTPKGATRAEVLESLTAQVILPGYTAASDEFGILAQSVDALCSSPGEGALDTARNAWRGARGAWLLTESYRFGPAMDRRSASLVDWWPIDEEKIDRNLAIEDTMTTERVSEFLPATQRGLGAVEYLLFGPGSESLADGQVTRHRCAYLRSVAVVASEEVAGILSDWRGSEGGSGYAGYFDGTGSLALFDSDAEAEVVRSLVFQVRSIANMRLGAGLGIDVAVDASAIPTGDADNSREDLLSQLDSIASVYRGSERGLGLSARVASVSAETNTRMLDAIEATIAATRSLERSIIAQLKANPDQIRAVYDNMKQMQLVLNTEIVSLLGVSVGFSDTDGDS